jgi:hypothetical protein
MNNKLVHRIFAGIVFLLSFLQYLSTAQVSVSFWDCAEFIPAGYLLQVPHPPGTPFFLILGRFFSMIPFADNIAFRINTISVLSSAFSVLFVYLIAVKFIESYKNKRYTLNNEDKPAVFESISVFLVAAIGALSFSLSDTFWFNGVESEIYAISCFCFSISVWLMMVWRENSDKPGSEKYILLTAYVLGIAIGIHLMAVLAIVPMVMIVVFQKYLNDDKFTLKTSYYLLGQVALCLVIGIILWAGQNTTDVPSPEDYKAFDKQFAVIMGVANIIYMLIFRRQIFARDSFYLPFLFGIPILAIVFPISYEILPKYIAEIAGNNNTVGLVLFLILLGACLIAASWAKNNKKVTLSLGMMCLFFVLLGFSTYAEIIIRSNKFTVMNENEPKDFKQLVSYLNREQYGDFPTFKRRYSAEPHQQGVYANYSSDLDFLWRYQMNHMMTRYWLWNYAGRESWEQDAGPNIAPFNSVGNVIGKLFNIKFAGETKDSLFGIPLLLGLLGIYYQFRKDWKLAAIFMTMFIFMGYITAYYQNQEQPQPRERDYFYVGAFFVFSIWLSMGLMYLYDLAAEKIKNIGAQKAALAAVLLFGIIFVPVRMLQANYHTHDRSQNWLPWDYAYNLLQSCAPNAVLFTNGDNDTFPLWYIQDVEGVRRDVKVVNLSLGNTDWYIRQLKNNDPYNVGTLNLRWSDDEIAGLRPVQFEPTRINVLGPGKDNPAYSELNKLVMSDTLGTPVDTISWVMPNTLTYGQIKAIRVQDMLIREIVEANNWKRPIYFSITCSEDSKIGLGDYLKLEGMAYRLVPEKRKNYNDLIQPDIMAKQLLFENPGYNKNYEPGLKFRNLNNPAVFYDDNQTRMVQGYRHIFYKLASYYAGTSQKEKALLVINTMNQKISTTQFPMDAINNYLLARIYSDIGEKEKVMELTALVEKEVKESIKNNEQTYYNPYQLLGEMYEYTKQWQKAIDLFQQFANPQSPDYQQVMARIQYYKMMLAGKNPYQAVDTVKKK